jgi:hypothetical protein
MTDADPLRAMPAFDSIQPADRSVGHLALTTLFCSLADASSNETGLWFGGEMLFKIAIALLIVWLLGMSGVYHVGNLAHVFLLVGLMLLLLAVLKAREAALRRPEFRNSD